MFYTKTEREYHIVNIILALIHGSQWCF